MVKIKGDRLNEYIAIYFARLHILHVRTKTWSSCFEIILGVLRNRCSRGPELAYDLILSTSKIHLYQYKRFWSFATQLRRSRDVPKQNNDDKWCNLTEDKMQPLQASSHSIANQTRLWRQCSWIKWNIEQDWRRDHRLCHRTITNYYYVLLCLHKIIMRRHWLAYCTGWLNFGKQSHTSSFSRGKEVVTII